VRDDVQLFVLRIGDAERDDCIDELREHHVRGRLSVAEYERRTADAMHAVTAADLQRLLVDLPSRTGRRPASRRRRVVLTLAPSTAVVATSWLWISQMVQNQTMVFTASMTTGAVALVSQRLADRARGRR
jgi:hypothetical protein